VNRAAKARRKLKAGFDDNLVVFYLKLVNYVEGSHEKDEKFKWVEEQDSCHDIVRVNTIVLISLGVLLVSIVGILR
jgi:hypothetical protein